MRSSQSGSATEHDRVIDTARLFRKVIGLISLVLVAYFSWLKVSGTEIIATIGSIPARVIHQLTLVIYFTSWVAGCNKDLELQEVSYVRAPRTANFGVGVSVMLGLFFAAMCAARSMQQFLAFLAVFLALDVIGWIYMTKRLLPPVYTQSKAVFKAHNNKVGLVRLEFTWRYVAGKWKRARYWAMATLLVALTVFVLSPAPQWIQPKTQLPADALIALAILGYVLVVEAWMWTQRLRCSYCHEKIEEILKVIS
jgi:hypothetical protein